VNGPVLITGAGGQLGYELQRLVPAGVAMVAMDRDQLDLTDVAAIDACLASHHPSVIINGAAYTAVDRAESEPGLARAVNAHGPAALARAAARHDARLIQISTDFVFGGTSARPWRPDDAVAPQSVYGQTKHEGERAVLDALGTRALVIRTAWLYSAQGGNFVKTMLRLMRERDAVRVVSDQVGTPTWAQSLAHTVWAAVRAPAISGILHWTDAGVASWYDFAVAIQEEALGLGLLDRAVPVHAITSAAYPVPARRPPYSVLDTTATTQALGVVPPHWRVNLRRMLGELADA
jgi:dTDP-4-dehydrorhamnose reductase